MAIGNVGQGTDWTTNREDFTGKIRMLWKYEKFLFGNLSVGTKATNDLHQWPADEPRASAANAQYDGYTVTHSALTQASKNGNYVQILGEEAAVSDNQEANLAVGQEKGSLAWQVFKKKKALAGDAELALLTGTSAAPASGTTQAAEMDGVIAMIARGGNTSAAASATASFDGSAGEALLKGILQMAWDDGGNVDQILTTAARKDQINNFTGSATENISDVKTKKVIAVVNLYETDFSEAVVSIRIHRDCPANYVICMEMKTFAISKKYDTPVTMLGKVGAYTGVFFNTALTLECDAYKASSWLILSASA